MNKKRRGIFLLMIPFVILIVFLLILFIYFQKREIFSSPNENSFLSNVEQGKDAQRVTNASELFGQMSEQEARSYKTFTSCLPIIRQRRFFNEPTDGKTVEEMVRNFLIKHPDIKIDMNLLVQKVVSKKDISGFEIFLFEQEYQSIPVLYSGTNFVFKNKYLLFLNSFYHHDISLDITPRISILNALETAKSSMLLDENTVVQSQRIVIYPLLQENCQYSYYLAYEFIFPLVSVNGVVFTPAAYIDANTGNIISIFNIAETNSFLTGQTHGLIYPQNSLEEPINKPFPHERVYSTPSNTEAYSSYDGAFNLSLIDTDNRLRGRLSGRFVELQRDNGVFSQFNVYIPTTGYGDINWENYDTSLEQDESNVYYHINRVHDFFTQGGVFNLHFLDYKMVAHVESLIVGPCNAGYGGGHISFGTPSPTHCLNPASISDIIYHEYTHAVVNNIIPNYPNYGDPGKIDEGYSDYYSCSLNDDSCNANNWWYGMECYRNCKNKLKYPEDYGNPAYPHDGMEIISGALWDVREELGQQIGDELALMALELQPFSFQELEEDFLIVDDDNGNLSDGTPHLAEICQAFTNHGINISYCITVTK